MTTQEFNQLNFEEQDNLLYQNGRKLTTVVQEWHEIDLYSLEDFFVEYRMLKDHDADEIKAMEKSEFDELYQNTILLPKPSSN